VAAGRSGSYVSEVAPLSQRGRALSMVGGVNRIGNFVGPLIGGLFGQHLGLESAFFVQAAMGLAAASLMFIFVAESEGSEHLEAGGLSKRLASTVIEHRHVFATAGVAMIALGVVRQARQVFIPLWGEQIGLDVAQIGILASISFFIDSAVFYPSGHAMDHWGRKWTGVPCILIIGVALCLLPLTDDFYSFMAIAVLSGFGNGLGAGINQTLGADFAPPDRRGEFLGVWRLVSDAGQAGGPLLISFLTGLGGLALASLATGGIGLLGAGVMVALMPETLVQHRLNAESIQPGSEESNEAAV
jgi:MFS family permease